MEESQVRFRIKEAILAISVEIQDSQDSLLSNEDAEKQYKDRIRRKIAKLRNIREQLEDLEETL